jgi:hypothetical protein
MTVSQLNSSYVLYLRETFNIYVSIFFVITISQQCIKITMDGEIVTFVTDSVFLIRILFCRLIDIQGNSEF